MIRAVMDFVASGFYLYIWGRSDRSDILAGSVCLSILAGAMVPSSLHANEVGPLGGWMAAETRSDISADPGGERYIGLMADRNVGPCLVVGIPNPRDIVGVKNALNTYRYGMILSELEYYEPAHPPQETNGPGGPLDVYSGRSDMQPGVEIIRAVLIASKETGADPTLLLSIAWFESQNNAKSRNRLSTATGLFQFTHDSWIEAVKKYGEQHGYGWLSKSITTRDNGTLVVQQRFLRKILELRQDPTVSAIFAAEVILSNNNRLEENIGRKTADADLYFLHVLGLNGASRFLRVAYTSPEASSMAVIPGAVKRNPGLFSSGGRILSAGEARKRVENALQQTKTEYRKIVRDGHTVPASPSVGHDNRTGIVAHADNKGLTHVARHQAHIRTQHVVSRGLLHFLPKNSGEHRKSASKTSGKPLIQLAHANNALK